MDKLPEPRLIRHDEINNVWHVYYDNPFVHHEMKIRIQIEKIRNHKFSSIDTEKIKTLLHRLGVREFEICRKKAWHYTKWWSTTVNICYHFSTTSLMLNGLTSIFRNLSMGGSANSFENGIVYQNLQVVNS